ncbi:VQ motif-containing protein [Actinidia rufa]|uniref:VQ motif-containing protein n=1 Tax=Actinidia rufa TaxID=165716 RepID=A0A7J0GF08_9ERIC|nr:VQ motif-containing protein [Actinidia rufa]
MADNLASMEPWTFRPSFADTWISEAFARDTETLTKALQKSLSTRSHAPFFTPETPLPPPPPVLQTMSGSGSDPETPASKHRSSSIPVNGNSVRPTKRKSRASKRTTTTFITADPANFRQMVQQVTGVRFGGQQMAVSPVLKPEPQRPVVSQGCLPTLDTSAFLLEQVVSVRPSLNVVPPALVGEGGGGGGFDFESFSSFPTLESWKVM